MGRSQCLFYLDFIICFVKSFGKRSKSENQRRNKRELFSVNTFVNISTVKNPPELSYPITEGRIHSFIRDLYYYIKCALLID